MFIEKRNGSVEDYRVQKIKKAIAGAFVGTSKPADEETLIKIVSHVESDLKESFEENDRIQVESIQNYVEKGLMELGFYEVAKSYILYREEHAKARRLRKKLAAYFPEVENLEAVLVEIESEFCEREYNLDSLFIKYRTFHTEGLDTNRRLSLLMKAAVELTTQETPKWESIAARFLQIQFYRELNQRLKTLQLNGFYEKLVYLTKEGLYGSYILDHYTKEEVESLSKFMNLKRDNLFTYSGLELLLNRYVIRNHQNQILETPQEMFLGIAMHLAMKEKKDRPMWVKRFYDMLSELKVTMATPTLSNARKPYHQLSSCFIDTVPDSLDGIYRSLDNFARVSKFGGGMGMYFGKVRAKGSTIRGFEGAAGGVIRWIRLANDTAVAVDQLGVRQGAVAVYLDAWHKDLPEFLSLRTNNGDDRTKAHDVFPAVCYPDLFWKLARDDINADWHMMCPHEIKTVKGYCLEDSYGEEWEMRYRDCVKDPKIDKRSIPVKEIIRLILKSAVETGTPFAFNRDHVNRANPNNHQGVIYCSNLCTEIAQNMSGIEEVSQEIKEVNGETVVVSTTKPGDFVVCNLASLSLGKLNVNDPGEIEYTVEAVVRALDNVIDLNFFPLPYAKLTNHKYRPIGMGVSGYHHMLAKEGISWESEEHLNFVDKLFEQMNYSAVKASMQLAKEKGRYHYFEGSDYETGTYFTKRNYTSQRWQTLKEEVKRHGLRNGYLNAIAPTSSTSIISGTTAGIDPIMSRYFLEEKKNGLMPRVAPELSMKTFWLYKNAHLIDQAWSVKACATRQRHIDQAQSMNFYITNDYTLRTIMNLYILAWEQGVKTVYYVRSKSLEVEECDVCSS